MPTPARTFGQAALVPWVTQAVCCTPPPVGEAEAGSVGAPNDGAGVSVCTRLDRQLNFRSGRGEGAKKGPFARRAQSGHQSTSASGGEGHESLVRALCLATTRCINLGPSFSQCREQAIVYAVGVSSERKRVAPEIPHQVPGQQWLTGYDPIFRFEVFC